MPTVCQRALGFAPGQVASCGHAGDAPVEHTAPDESRPATLARTRLAVQRSYRIARRLGEGWLDVNRRRMDGERGTRR